MTNTNELTAKLKVMAKTRLAVGVRVMGVRCSDLVALTEALEAAEHESAVNWEAATSLVEENEELKRRIAELEARTLTVKLPHWSGYTCSGEGAMLDACVRSLESQGFTVQIEGE